MAGSPGIQNARCRGPARSSTAMAREIAGPGFGKCQPFLDRVLTAAGIDHDIKVYPEAGHGFLNDHDPGALSRLDLIIAKLAAA